MPSTSFPILRSGAVTGFGSSYWPHLLSAGYRSSSSSFSRWLGTRFSNWLVPSAGWRCSLLQGSSRGFSDALGAIESLTCSGPRSWRSAAGRAVSSTGRGGISALNLRREDGRAECLALRRCLPHSDRGRAVGVVRRKSADGYEIEGRTTEEVKLRLKTVAETRPRYGWRDSDWENSSRCAGTTWTFGHASYA